MGRERDRKILKLAAKGPFTKRQVAHRFPRHEDARVRINKLHEPGRLMWLGTVQLKEWNRQEEWVYAAPLLSIKADWITYDTMLTESLLKWPNAEIVRGSKCDPRSKADTDLVFAKCWKAFFELARDTKSPKTVED